MDSKSRLLKAWQFEETDRVPIEIIIDRKSYENGLPGADVIYEFEQKEADNFLGAAGFDWGFIGVDSQYKEEIIEDVPGEYFKMKKTYITSTGEFYAITIHKYSDTHGEGDPSDFHWEKRFIHTLDDFIRLIKAKRSIKKFDIKKYNEDCRRIGNRGLPATGLLHPLGVLVRNSNMEEVYAWLINEEELVFEFLEKNTQMICDSLKAMEKYDLEEYPVFRTYALEMFIPPWLGEKLFMKFIFPFDKRINDAVHRVGGRHFAHCHGNSSKFLEHFADMGIDGVDPVEPPPYGDNILTDVKNRVGKRMLIAGNIPSQAFPLDSFEVSDVRQLVKDAISQGAPGGGFTLRTTGSAHVGHGKTYAQRIKSINCGLAMIEAWREFGT